jgi:type VI secretion system protein VasG
VAARCTEVESGARNVDNILTNSLLPDISVRLLERIAAGEKLTGIRVAVREDGFDYAWDAVDAAGAEAGVVSSYTLPTPGAPAAQS